VQADAQFHGFALTVFLPHEALKTESGFDGVARSLEADEKTVAGFIEDARASHMAQAFFKDRVVASDVASVGGGAETALQRDGADDVREEKDS
jgi:hypothetical protein